MSSNPQVKYYVKRPIPIEAIQWTGDNLKDVIDFTGKDSSWYEHFRDLEEYEEYVKIYGGQFKIYTLDGHMNAYPGDYIIRGVRGEHYPCKKEIFEETYEECKVSSEWQSMKSDVQ